MSVKRNRWVFYYSLIFIFGILSYQLALNFDGKALIMASDGVKQHFTVIGYIGRVVRDLLSGKGYRLVNLQLGQGFDVLTTLSYYGYTDPICYLGVLAKGKSIETVYTITVFIRAYLAGNAFGFYEKKIGIKDQFALTFSVVIYVFSGYFILLMGRHPYFLNGALYLPLMLNAVEGILKENKWWMFTLVTAAMLIVNFYFAYMNTIVTIIYIVVRLIVRMKDDGLKSSVKNGVTLLCSWLLGAGLASFVFVPVARLYLNNSRLGIEAGYRESMLHYSRSHYTEFFTSAFAPGINPEYYSRLGFLPLALIGLIGLLWNRNRVSRQATLGLALCFVAACIPGLGRAMNGMAYVTNRWIYALALFLALCAGLGLQNMFKRKANFHYIGFIALFCAILMGAYFYVNKKYKAMAAPVLLAAHSVVLLAYNGKKRMSREKVRRMTGILLAISCFAYVFIEYSSKGYNRDVDLADRGVFQTIEADVHGSIIDDSSVYRINQYRYDDPNSALLNYNGTSFYWSLVNSSVSEYYRKLWLPTQTKPFQIYGLGSSAFVNEVASVKYYTQKNGTDSIIPFGYEDKTSDEDGGFEVYQNAYALPIGYAFDSYISESAYQALPVEDRIQILTRCAICDSDSDKTAGMKEEDYESSAKAISFGIDGVTSEFKNSDNVQLGMGDSITLRFNAPADHEIYLIIDGLNITKSKNTRVGIVQIETNCGRTFASISDPKSNLYCPQEGLAICLGSGEMDYCVIDNDSTKDYRFNSIRLCAVPLSGYKSDVEKLLPESLNNVRVDNNTITGNIAVGGERIMQISVPYNGGWSAYVDGEKTDIFRCGGMYMGLKLSKGDHRVELSYDTPGLKTGIIISVIAGIITILLAIVTRKQERKKT